VANAGGRAVSPAHGTYPVADRLPPTQATGPAGSGAGTSGKRRLISLL